MANLKDLIVQGTSRFIGKIYGKISNAELADKATIGKTLGKTVAPYFTNDGTATDNDDITITYNDTINIGSYSYKSFSIAINPDVAIIIAGYYKFALANITAKNGTFINGQHLSIWAKDVKLLNDIIDNVACTPSGTGYEVLFPNKSPKHNPSASITWPGDAPKWFDFIYYNGKWYGRTYAEIYATNDLDASNYVPVTSSKIYQKCGGGCYNETDTFSSSETIDLPIAGYYNLAKTTTTTNAVINYTLPDSQLLPMIFIVRMDNPCKDSSVGAVAKLISSNGNIIATRGFTYSGPTTFVLASSGDYIIVIGKKTPGGTTEFISEMYA